MTCILLTRIEMRGPILPLARPCTSGGGGVDGLGPGNTLMAQEKKEAKEIDAFTHTVLTVDSATGWTAFSHTVPCPSF
jgi:hypothetical protein